jgi:pyruvate kinase
MFRRRRGDRGEQRLSIADAVCHAACMTSLETEATAIMTVSQSGDTARMLSKYRAPYPIYACVIDSHIARHLSLSWGVYPLLIQMLPTTDEVLRESERLCREARYIESGDTVVVVAGLTSGESGTTNMLTVLRIS